MADGQIDQMEFGLLILNKEEVVYSTCKSLSHPHLPLASHHVLSFTPRGMFMVFREFDWSSG